MIKVGDVVSAQTRRGTPVVGTVTKIQGDCVYSLWEFTDLPGYPRPRETWCYHEDLIVVENPKDVKSYEDALV